MNVIHVITAFENELDLKRLIKAISKQENKDATIVCVDNSIINSKNILKVCNSLSINYKLKFHYLNNILNDGSSKGFALGMQKAYDLGAEWIWLHDQDGYPNEECLSKLAESKIQEGILVPCVVGENNKRLRIFTARIDKRDNWKPIKLFQTGTEIDIAGTAGLFINRKVIDVIGVYNSKHFFVGLEDFDYCLRAKNSGFKIKIIEDAVYFHPDKWNRIDWDIKNIFKYFGENNNTRIQNGEIHFNCFHTKHNFILSFVYSILRMTKRYIDGTEINYTTTIKAYLTGILNRYKKQKKYVIELSNHTWIEF